MLFALERIIHDSLNFPTRLLATSFIKPPSRFPKTLYVEGSFFGNLPQPSLPLSQRGVRRVGGLPRRPPAPERGARPAAVHRGRPVVCPLGVRGRRGPRRVLAEEAHGGGGGAGWGDAALQQCPPQRRCCWVRKTAQNEMKGTFGNY